MAKYPSYLIGVADRVGDGRKSCLVVDQKEGHQGKEEPYQGLVVLMLGKEEPHQRLVVLGKEEGPQCLTMTNKKADQCLVMGKEESQ